MMWNEGFYKVLLIGDSNVGKTGIQQRYVDDIFLNTIPTIGANIKYKTVIIDGEKLKLQIRDLAGQESFHNDTSVFYKGVDGIMLVFDITNQESFTHINNWFKQTDKYVGSDMQLLLVGNKCDLSSERAVSHAEAEQLAMEIGRYSSAETTGQPVESDDVLYIEISAKTGQHVKEAFDLMVKKILKDPVEENKRLIIQSLKKAKEKQGTVPVTFLKVFLTGSASVGKTSFSHLLLKKEIKPNPESTGLVSTSHVVPVQKVAYHDGSDDVTWVELNRSLEIHCLRSLLVPSNLSSSSHDQTDVVTESSGTDNEIHSTTFMQKSVAFFWLLTSWLTWVVPSFLYPVNNASSPAEPSDQSNISTTESRGSGALNKEENDSINSEKLSSFKHILQDSLISNSNQFVYMPGKKLNIITILDTGGQPQYIHLLPTINIHPTVNFVIHDLSKDLSDQIQVEYNKNGKQVKFPYPLKCCYLDIIELLMSAGNDCVDNDTSYAKHLNLNANQGNNNDSYLCLVGTHKDQVSDEVVKDTATKLTTLVNNMRCKPKVWQNEDKTVLFAVDNTTAGSEKEDRIAKIIRNKIQSVAAARDELEVPITWMLLELEIQQFCEQNHKAYISFEQCLQLAKDGGLMSSNEELKDALNYHHFLGVLLYFKEIKGLCDFIIIDHQWWFDKLSSIICLTLEQSHDHHAVNKLKFQGILSKKLLDYIEWNDDIKKEYFLSLLYHKKIIASLEKDTYFIPFVLPPYNPQGSDTLKQYGEIQGEPLLVQFHSGLLPRGFFCSLVVHLLRKLPKGWQPHFSNNMEECHIFNNLITFCLPDAYSLSLFDNVSYLELQIRHKEENVRNSAHHDAYQNLVPFLAKVCKLFKSDVKRLRYGFLCLCKSDIGNHVAFLQDTLASAKFATCVVNSTYSIRMTPSHMLWFSQPFSTNNSGHSCPTMKLLSKFVIPQVAKKWNALGLELLDFKYENSLNNFEVNYGNNIELCCRKTLEKWLETKSDDATWDQLIKALKNIDMHRTADNVKEMLNQSAVGACSTECQAVLSTNSSSPHQLPLESNDSAETQAVLATNSRNMKFDQPQLKGYSGKPLLKDLQNFITPYYAAHWTVIGTQLGIHSGILQGIRASSPADAFRCCNMMLESWLDTDPNATWDKIREAIECPGVTKAIITFN